MRLDDGKGFGEKTRETEGGRPESKVQMWNVPKSNWPANSKPKYARFCEQMWTHNRIIWRVKWTRKIVKTIAKRAKPLSSTESAIQIFQMIFGEQLFGT